MPRTPRSRSSARLVTLRAYAHFDLTNLYGKPYDPETAATDRTAPLSTTIDIEQIYRPSNVAAIYEQIVEDIENAERLMTVEKQPDATRNYRFSADALMGFKARVMLYMRNWQAAYDSAKSLLPKYNLVDFNAAVETNALPWKATSEEAILAWERPFASTQRRPDRRLRNFGEDSESDRRNDGQTPRLSQSGERLR